MRSESNDESRQWNDRTMDSRGASKQVIQTAVGGRGTAAGVQGRQGTPVACQAVSLILRFIHSSRQSAALRSTSTRCKIAGQRQSCVAMCTR